MWLFAIACLGVGWMEFTDRFCHLFRRQVAADMTVSSCLPTGADNPDIITAIAAIIGTITLSRLIEFIINLFKRQPRTPDILLPLASVALLATGQYWLAFGVIILSVINDQIELKLNRQLYFRYSQQSKLSAISSLLMIATIAISVVYWRATSDPSTAINLLIISAFGVTSLIGTMGVRRFISAWQKNDVQFTGRDVIYQILTARQLIFDDPGTLTSPQLSVTKIMAKDSADQKVATSILHAIATHCNSEIQEAIAIYCRQNQIEPANLYSIRQVSKANFFARLGNDRVLIGNYSFMNSNQIPDIPKDFQNLTCLFVAINGKLMGCIHFDRKIRTGATKIAHELRQLGIKSIITLTKESRRRAYQLGRNTKIDQAYAQLSTSNKTQVVAKLSIPSDSPVVVKNYSVNKSYLSDNTPHIWLNHKNSINRDKPAIYFPNGKLSSISMFYRATQMLARQIKISAIAVVLVVIILELLTITGIINSAIIALAIRQLIQIVIYIYPIKWRFISK